MEVAQLYDTKDGVLEALVHKLLLEVTFHRMHHVPRTHTHTHLQNEDVWSAGSEAQKLEDH